MIFSFFRLLGAIFSVYLTIFVATQYSILESGQFFTAYSVLLILSGILKLGFEDGILKAASGSVSDEVICSWIVCVAGVACLFASILFYLDITFFAKFTGNEKIAFFVSLPAMVVTGLISFYLQGKQKFIYATLTQSIFTPGAFIIIACYSSYFDHPVPLVVNIGCSNLTALIAALWIYMKTNKVKFTFKLVHILSVRKVDQCYLYLNSLMGVFYLHGLILLAAYILGEKEVSQLTVALRLCQASSVLVLVMNFTFAPKIRQLFTIGDYLAIKKLYLSSVFLGLALAASCTLFYLLLIDQLQFLFFGKTLISGSLFWPLWAGYAVNLCLGTIGYLYIMLDRHAVSTTVGVTVMLAMYVSFVISNPDNLLDFAIMASAFIALPRVVLLINLIGESRSGKSI
jgi:O-antigen/teichoic acid export membrane protein